MVGFSTLSPVHRLIAPALGWWVVAMVAVGPVGAAPGSISGPADGAARPETDRLTPQQEKDLKLLVDVLKDPRIDDAKRRDAASSLLARRWPAAEESLRQMLVKSADPSTPRLIAQALAASSDPPELLTEPLLKLLGHAEAPVRAAAAAALARYETRTVLNRLIRVARDDQAELPQRLAAIDSLAEQYQSRAVGALVELAAPTWPREIRDQAMRRLAETTGISEFGFNSQAWQQWWQQVKNLPPQRWLSGMLQSLSRRKAELETDRQRLLDKMTETYNRLYRATDEKQRPALLIEMFSETYDPIRLLAMQIVERELINAEPVGPEVRQAIRGHLTDSNPSVRAAAAKVLRDLGDEKAAAAVVGLLATESDLDVRQAYLSLLSRMPQRQAVEPVLALTEQQTANGSASGFLAAADAAGLLNADQQARARAFARRLIADPKKKPEVPVVQLLGRLAEPADQAVFRSLLKRAEPAVRQAAAEPFVAGRFDPAPLWDYFGDAVLGSKAIEAAAAHGQSVAMIERLLTHEPAGGEPQQAWVGAVVAIAKRLKMADLAKVDAMLAGHEQKRGLRRLVLATAVPAAEQPIDTETRAGLLVNLAELYLADGQIDKAKALADRLARGAGLSGAVADRLSRVRVAAYLGADDVEGGLKLAGQWLGRNAQAGPIVAGLLLDAIDKRLAAKKTDQAALLIGRMQQLVGPLADQALVDRLQRARQQLQQMQSQPAPPQQNSPSGVLPG